MKPKHGRWEGKWVIKHIVGGQFSNIVGRVNGGMFGAGIPKKRRKAYFIN
jgi:hypothetical protein